ncbi:hypothetical protein wNo_10480 [Wolbachia endosymbiont of Drosophila simulans wNo]|uniref:hypothetical protein n=1 Tax=unclassified Wolbachia TaxID=2640676 RepID=UPI0002D24E4F|nr:MULTISPECIES: hypothetical protein [unclassified Wolbachia]AGJ99419.1 hypothetical protein wNo_10480 [Wolbachia endosymbiont of Drosophila simulans wNo]QCB62610.1 hypothetical protein EJA99_03150 [Wolbachia endosymbiont of Drosophila mauritiana]QCB63656.1 hypothetical protein EJB00_03140 [Wolbachia endosymbiont of Drosophila mauritiana]QWE33066.1 Uncharacterized protein WwMa_01280 [Wolbachia endosymbiont of Drosophila simulans]TGB06966.1 hypothetical protein E5C28_02340 [Wolbachia endosymbi
MEDFITARRKDDAVISVSQDNEKKNVLILGLNQAARNLLKCEERNLLNKPLINILSARAAEDMKSYLEYTEDGCDLRDILPKVIGFSLIDAKGEDIKTKVKVFRTTQFTNSKINYELLIRDISLFHKLGMFRDKYLIGKKYKNHNLFNIPDNESTIFELYVVLNFAFEYQINAVIGIIGLNSSCNKENDALKIIIEHFYKNCRSDDFLGCIDENKVLFILMNCDANNTSKIVNRIHSSINKQLLKRKLSSISIIYGNIIQKHSVKNA